MKMLTLTKIKWMIVLVLLSACSRQVRFKDTALNSFMKGYQKSISGEVLAYHAPQPEAKDALLVRSIDKDLYISWETEPVPEGFTKDTARFIWMAAIDVNEEQHVFRLFVNDREILSFTNPADTTMDHWTLRGSEGVTLSFRSVMIDKYGDLMGYMLLSLPAPLVEPGKPLRLKISGESAGSRVWYMTFRYAPQPEMRIDGQEAVVKSNNGPLQVIRLELVNLDEADTLAVTLGKEHRRVVMNPGLNTYRFTVPVVDREKKISVLITQQGNLRARTTFVQHPVKRKIVYLLPHSHVDIGYTHVQEEVKKIQWDNLEKAVSYARKSKDYPEGERFIWNSEVAWPLESWFAAHDTLQQKEMIAAVRNGWIELDGLFANELTGLCRPEELMQLIEPAYQLANRCGVKLTTAMISDIPGYTQGLMTVLTHYGIRYFSVGTNVFDHIGTIITRLGDKPFYWVTPSGNEKVLCWVHGKGYSTFHGGKTFAELINTPDQNPIFQYLKDLKEEDYPYDIVALRYNIGADNGPPDPTLADGVKAWNEKYYSPSIVIASASKLFHDFEEKYGKTLPERSGDLTPYWSDGAYSSALETAMNRESAENMVRAITAWSMFRVDSFPEQRAYDAWRNILLFDEHTWGSYNSISEPESAFTRSQWERKREFAVDGSRQAGKLLAQAVPAVKKSGVFTVINTQSFPHSGWIEIPATQRKGMQGIGDPRGQRVPSQVLKSGNLLFHADSLEPFAVRSYRLLPGAALSPASSLKVVPENGLLENGRLKIIIDSESGTVRSITEKERGTQYVDTSYNSYLNEYLYVRGRRPDHPEKPQHVKVVVGEDGPLTASLVVLSDAPGASGLSREYRLYQGDPHLYITNLVDKTLEYNPEGVYFTFPFTLENGKVRINSAWSVYEPGPGQLPGSCNNYYTVQRWVDVANSEVGIALFPLDAAMLELGRITTDGNVVGWLETVQQPEGHLFSYVMNNYWGTNYRAGQEGKVKFRYVLFPHRAYRRESLEKEALSVSQPLLLVAGETGLPKIKLLVPGNKILVTSALPVPGKKGVRLRLYNISDQTQSLGFLWKTVPGKAWYTTPSLKEGSPVDKDDRLLPFEVKDVLVKF